MTKIRVDYDLCEANGACQKTAPHVFTIDENETMRVLLETLRPEDVEKVRAAIRRCPRGALSLVDDGNLIGK